MAVGTAQHWSQPHPALLLASCVASDKSLDLSEPLFPHSSHDNNPCLHWCRKSPQKMNRKPGRERCWVSGGRLPGSGLTGSRARPSPASLPAQAWPDGGSREMQPSCTLLVYFEKPPVSFPAWGHVVAAGLCSQDGLRAEPCPSLPALPRPVAWTHTMAPSSGTTAPTRQRRRAGTQRGFGVGAGQWSVISRTWGAGAGAHASPGPAASESCPQRPSASPVTQQHY